MSNNAGPGAQNLPVSQENSGVTIIDQEQAPLIRNLSIEIDKLLSDEDGWSDQQQHLQTREEQRQQSPIQRGNSGNQEFDFYSAKVDSQLEVLPFEAHESLVEEVKVGSERKQKGQKMPLKSIGNKLNEQLQLGAKSAFTSNSFVHDLEWDKEAEDLIDAATCPPLARIVSEMTTADSKFRSIGAASRRLKIFEKITLKEEENLLESEKHNDN